MTRHLRRLTMTALVALALSALPGSKADAGMFQYGYGYSGYYSTYYSPSWWSGGYSTYYSPNYYSPSYYTSSYAPAYGYGGWGSNDCCPQTCCAPCCSPCSPCCTVACAGGDCTVDPGGLKPRPDGSTSGGTRTFGNGTEQDKDWKGTDPKQDPPGYEREGTPPAAGSGSRDQEAQKPPAAGDVPVPQKKEAGSAPDTPPEKSPEAVRPANGTEGADANADDAKSEVDKAPQMNGPDVATRRTYSLPGLDRKLTSTSKPERMRSDIRAQLDEVQIARKIVDPAKLAGTAHGTPLARR